MTREQMDTVRRLEGHRVSLALTGGRRIDDAELVSAGRGRARTMWLYVGGEDLFVPVSEVRDAWEPRLASLAA